MFVCVYQWTRGVKNELDQNMSHLGLSPLMKSSLKETSSLEPLGINFFGLSMHFPHQLGKRDGKINWIGRSEQFGAFWATLLEHLFFHWLQLFFHNNYVFTLYQIPNSRKCNSIFYFHFQAVLLIFTQAAGRQWLMPTLVPPKYVVAVCVAVLGVLYLHKCLLELCLYFPCNPL